MPTFVAQVKNTQGKILKEKVQASSPEQARAMLKQQFPAVGKIQQSGLDIDLSGLEAMFSGLSVKDMAVFSRQFATMVNAGVAIVRALSVLSAQTSNPRLKKALEGISADVQEGESLSDAMSKHPQCFDKLYLSMVEAGEVGGVLDEVLNRLAKVLEDIARLKNQVKSAMTYPIAVGVLAILVFIGMTVFIIPVFAGIFEGLGVELPALTQTMLNISKIMRSPRIFIPIAFIAGAVFAFRRYYNTYVGRRQIDKILLTMPVVGDLNQKNAVARFCRIFGTLTRSGVPILGTLDIVRDVAGNSIIADAVEGCKQEIQQGGMLSIALARPQVFPPLAIQMISIGEETGELDAMMMKVADFYEDEVEQAVKALTSVLEPIMMVIIAGMVGLILVSMYLPMFKIFDELG
jgi:type IV pilus assembly protein PilC